MKNQLEKNTKKKKGKFNVPFLAKKQAAKQEGKLPKELKDL